MGRYGFASITAFGAPVEIITVQAESSAEARRTVMDRRCSPDQEIASRRDASGLSKWKTMKSDSYTIELSSGGPALIGIPRDATFSLRLNQSEKAYSIPIKALYKKLISLHARMHPTGKKRRRKLFTSSEDYREARKQGLV
jgi:hypothetical protein